MATTTPTLASADAPDIGTQQDSPASALVWISSLPAETASTTLAALEAAFAGTNALLASPDSLPVALPPNLRWLAARGSSARHNWVLSASDYQEAAELAEQHHVERLLLLGTHTPWVTPSSLRQLLTAGDASIDLIVPRPPVGGDEGLVNAALLYPLTRALFVADVHYPLPTDAVMSPRFARRMGQVAARAASAANDELLWPVSEAAVGNFSVREIALDSYTLPHPPQEAFQTLFTAVAASLFGDIESKASFWQRSRGFAPSATGSTLPAPTSASEVSGEVRSLVEAFRLAYVNLHDLWSLVLPPQTLLALKRLSLASPESFSLSPQVWARIIYDFALAYRLRTINRGHLLGALTPLYLAWVAAHARAMEAEPAAGPRLLAETAMAFETERAYIVSRWRWPDRFNP